MESFPFFPKPTRWKKRPSSKYPFYPAALFITSLILIFFFYITHNPISTSTLPVSRNSQSALCPQETLGQKFLMYAPHSGFSNQLSEFKNAVLMAAVLNRTLVVPPVLDHHAVALGSCPKFRVLSPNQLRLSVWNHVFELIRNLRYVSMSDILDLSKVISDSSVRIIDFRDFVSKWCGVNMDFACSRYSELQSSLSKISTQCGSALSGNDGNVRDCIYAVEEDCRTTVWTYQNDGEDGMLDLFQPDEQLKKKKNISFIRRRRDVYRALGPDSEAGSATVLAFGSLFTAPYKGSESNIDIHNAPRDNRVQSLIEKIEFLPFNPEITSAGKEFSLQTIKAPFLCAQLRLLDGQFKNHWKSTFTGLREKLESLKQKGPLPVHIFVMTDLPSGNWTETYLGDLARDSRNFKLFTLNEEDELVRKSATRLVTARQRTKSQSASKNLDELKPCDSQTLPDLRLYIEESICGCASLGFVGTAGSTIAESITLIRKHRVCL
ncbi:hypothetical protein DCAR_0209608 [Daucus carota subsp. sativus]|uniref:O-fucosyltransferase family protein n=1 Tax=Daucus carota subsp. sativus TaxID=79200 RepID=A0A166FE20_DAUCS|nr:PREDICTED: uncharacterized protein LOC108206346 [Daucus carota subsp. sativus]WOG90364.1 hypothetical protein DCAR_0209608 [Daucus carota subsp. sativus]